MSCIELKGSNTSLFFDERTGYLRRAVYRDNVIELDSMLWRIETAADHVTQYMEPTDTMKFSYELNGQNLSMYWLNEFIHVNVYVNLSGSKSKWNISATVLSDEYQLHKIEFPIIGSITSIAGEEKDDYLLLPWQNGLIIKNPLQTLLSKKDDIPFWLGRGGLKYENDYPSQFSYQFASYYSRSKYGLYFSTEDRQAYIKTMGFYYNGMKTGFDFKLTNYPENMGIVKSYNMPYRFVLDFFEGDWQQPVGLYREWAVKQKWCKTKLVEKHLPEKLAKTDLWRINHNSFDLGKRTQEYFDTAKALKEKTGGNLALHWYGWNLGEHDVAYPDYISKEHIDNGWPEELTAWNEKFSQEGIAKIPYINARLWDTEMESWRAENAIEAALKDKHGNLYEEPWKYNNLKPMCPTTVKWKEKVIDLCKELMVSNKFDGIYLDQVASFNARLCFDKTHTHPLGGGTWWNDAYHEMLNEIRDAVGKDKMITTESCCETYVDVFDLFLTLDTNLQNIGFPEIAGVENCESIPIFNMVYGEYALSYGSICKFSNTPEVFELNFIRNLLWGILPTVEGVDLSQINDGDSEEYFSILKRGVSFFKEFKELILYGRLKAIPFYNCEKREVCWSLKGEARIKQYPKVMAAIWTDRNGKDSCLFYNFDDGDQSVNMEGISLRIPAKSFQVIELPV